MELHSNSIDHCTVPAKAMATPNPLLEIYLISEKSSSHCTNNHVGVNHNPPTHYSWCIVHLVTSCKTSHNLFFWSLNLKAAERVVFRRSDAAWNLPALPALLPSVCWCWSAICSAQCLHRITILAPLLGHSRWEQPSRCYVVFNKMASFMSDRVRIFFQIKH